MIFAFLSNIINLELFIRGVIKMCAILLSINPQFVDRIMSGEKIYEYRISKCKQEVNKIFIRQVQ